MPIRIPRRLLVTLTAIATTAAAGALVAEPAVAGPTTGTVTGHVVMTDGSPAVGVPITFETNSSQYESDDPIDPTHVYRYTVVTDASGDYSLTDAQDGAYDVTIAPSAVWGADDHARRGTVTAGTTSTAPTLTAVHLSTLHGTVVSSEDGAPLGRAAVRLADPRFLLNTDVLTAADGTFTIRVAPGPVEVEVAASDRFAATRTPTVGEGEEVDLGPIALAPSGTAVTRVLSGSRHRIRESAQSAMVDGCLLDPGAVLSCPGAAIGPGYGVTVLQLAPGRHTVRYEVRNPFTSVVRHVTRSVVVRHGQDVTVAPVVVRVDPAGIGRVRSGTYRRGHAVVVRVDVAGYVDDQHPHLRTTFRVNGHAVTPISTSWRAPERGASKILIAKLPSKWSTRTSLSVTAVVHGTAAYAGQVTPATRLTRAR